MGFIKRRIRDVDFVLIATLVLMAVYGCLAVAAATHNHSDPYIPRHTVEKQLIWEAVGWGLMFLGMSFDYRRLKELNWWIYGSSFALLLAVFGFPRVQGSHSWINLKVLTFQPSELAKLALIIWLAAFMSKIDDSELPSRGFKTIWIIIPIVLVPFALIFKEPALGQSLVIIAIALTMYTVFAKSSHFFLLMMLVIVIVVGSTIVATVFPQQSTAFLNDVVVKHHLLKAYQVNRITTWLNPNYSIQNYGYNIHMGQIAIGSGGLFGQGFFNGIETNGGWIPNQWDDYIFTVIGEEFGFVGSTALVMLFVILIHRLIGLARRSSDSFGMYIIIGLVGMFSFQVFENIGMDMYLSPSTGITLPFISYGGTSLAIDYLAIGIALSVGLRRRQLGFS